MISSSSWLLKNIYSIQKVGWPPEKKNWSETNYNETKSGNFMLLNLRDIFSHRVSTETIIYLDSEWARSLSIENKEHKRSGLSKKTYFKFMQFLTISS